MSRIKLLDESLINKIAAGEVIERPASVLKELMENSLDAGASRLDIDLEEGGTKLIAVGDDGCGMTREEIPLSVTRHATSKIATAEDLFQIATLGFRGEALASITAVAKVEIASRPKGSKDGCKFIFAGGEQMLPWSGPEGTRILVQDLFATIPAREKFLRKSATEYTYCIEAIQAIALGHPEVSFRVHHNGKLVLDLEGIADSFSDHNRISLKALRQRAAQMFPRKNLDRWVAVEAAGAYGDVYGLVTPPGSEEGTSKHMWTFANGRMVKDQTLRRGVLRGFHSHLLKGRFPGSILFFRCPPELVDVNVHPAKMELRFQYPSEVQATIARAIRDGLRSGAWAHHQAQHQGIEDEAPPVEDAFAALPPQVGIPPVPRSFGFEGSRYSNDLPGPSSPPPRSYQSGGGGQKSGANRSFSALPSPARELFKTPSLRDMNIEKEGGIPWGELTFLGSFARCYLFFASTERLLLVDQHAFHERILYEQLLADGRLIREIQALLVPEVVQLEPGQIEQLREGAETIAQLGLALKIISDREVEVTAVPSVLSGRDLESLLSELAEKLASNDTPSPETLHHLLLATVACHSAVRSGEELPAAELEVLLRQAGDVDFYHNCPHGRRVLRWFTRAEIGRMFDR